LKGLAQKAHLGWGGSTMNLRRIKFRVTLLNLMLAIAVISVTLAISRPRTELWPTYWAVTWLSTRALDHDPVTHEALAQEFKSPDVIRDVLADEHVAGLARIKSATDPRQEVLTGIVIEVHPRGQGYYPPTRELIRVVVERGSAYEAVVIRDALVAAYLSRQQSGYSIRAVRVLPERVPHPLFDRPWKFRAVITLGSLLSIICLIVPIARSKRSRRLLVAGLSVALIFGAALWWFIAHPEFYIDIGRIRFF
jgi:hypothetical protein